MHHNQIICLPGRAHHNQTIRIRGRVCIANRLFASGARGDGSQTRRYIELCTIFLPKKEKKPIFVYQGVEYH